MDERTYIRLHDGMPDHPKVVGLSNAAFRLYVEALCWCSRQLTDGLVPAAALKRMGGSSPAAIRELAAAQLFEVGDGSEWVIHDYTEHQRTAFEVEQYRKSKQSAGTAGNHERWHSARGLVDPSCEFCTIADASHVRSHPDRTTESQTDRETSPETETDTKKEKKKELDQAGSDDDLDFVAFWSAYPRKIGKGHARKAWRAAVVGSHVDPKEIILACERFRDETRMQRTEQKFIPHPTTWLNAERYGDETASPNGRIPYPTSPWDN